MQCHLVPYHAQILPLGRFASSYITFVSIGIKVISRGARSLRWPNIMMNISQTASSCPLDIWRKSYFSHNYLPQICIRNCFFRAPNAKFFLPWEGGTRGHPHLVDSLARSFPRRWFSGHENIGHFQRRSLILMMNISETARLMLVFCWHNVVYDSAIPCPDHPPIWSLRSFVYFRSHWNNL